MVEVTAVYEGNLRCAATHGPSQSVLETDAPADNHGQGARYSPTDLVATALGTCMMTTMAIFTQRHEVDLTGTGVRVEKYMTAEPPRSIARLMTHISIPLPEDHPQREMIERAALTRPKNWSLNSTLCARRRLR